MAEGERQLRAGYFLLDDDGYAAVDSACCSPCSCCASNNFEATAVVTCVAPVKCDCVQYKSSVGRAFADSDGYCQWTWTFDVPAIGAPTQCIDEDWTLVLTYNDTTKIWSALFSRDSDPGNYYFMGGNLDETCSGGRLSGTFVLNGVAECSVTEECSVEIVL